jgi:hypothetical protein
MAVETDLELAGTCALAAAIQASQCGCIAGVEHEISDPTATPCERTVGAGAGWMLAQAVTDTAARTANQGLVFTCVKTTGG